MAVSWKWEPIRSCFIKTVCTNIFTTYNLTQPVSQIKSFLRNGEKYSLRFSDFFPALAGVASYIIYISGFTFCIVTNFNCNRKYPPKQSGKQRTKGFRCYRNYFLNMEHHIYLLDMERITRRVFCRLLFRRFINDPEFLFVLQSQNYYKTIYSRYFIGWILVQL